MVVEFSWIVGFMMGIEVVYEDKEDKLIVLIDVGVFRMLIYT